MWKSPGASKGTMPPRKTLAAYTDNDGYTISIVGQTPKGDETAMGVLRVGVMRITNPEGKMVRAGYWMGFPEKEWNISDKEWKKLTWEERAALEVKQQGTKYDSLAKRFNGPESR